MAGPVLAHSKVRFGDFDLDLKTGQLRKSGVLLHLPPQPFKVLSLLANRPMELVTREEIRNEVWGSETFVDFEHGLNFVINKIRETLGDDAGKPRYIETVPRRGYRFICPLAPTPVRPSTPAATQVRVEDEENAEPSSYISKRKLHWLLLGLALACGVLVAASYLLRPFTPPRVLGYKQLTHDRAQKELSCDFFSKLVTDGPRVFFPEPSSSVMQASSTGGDTIPVPAPLSCFVIFDISPDKTELLGRSQTNSAAPRLWVFSITSGLAHPLGNLMGHEATWSPDGRNVAYATTDQTQSGDELYVAEKDGSGVRKLTRFEKGSVVSIRWSPDGKVLRLVVSGKLWEVSVDGANPHPIELFPGENRPIYGINWTTDGRYFVFSAADSSSRVKTEIWVRREAKSSFRRSSAKPVQLTNDPMSFGNPAPSPDGKQIFVVGGRPQGELVRYDLASHRLEPFLSGISAEQLTFSRDGRWVTYVTYPEGILWRSRVDGSERMQLTLPPLRAVVPRWSPDGTRIAFSGRLGGGTWKTYIVSAAGGNPEVVSESTGDDSDPTWYPDGNSLIFIRFDSSSDYPSSRATLVSLELRTRQVSFIPGSENLFSPRLSPDGRFLLAMDYPYYHKLMLFDLEKQKWSLLADAMEVSRVGFGYPQWSSDGKFVYVAGGDPDALVFYKVRIPDGKLERLATVEVPEGVNGYFGVWLTTGPDGTPYLLRDRTVQEIYALNVDLP